MENENKKQGSKWIIGCVLGLLGIALIVGACFLILLGLGSVDTSSLSSQSIISSGNPNETIAVITIEDIIDDVDDGLHEKTLTEYVVDSLEEAKNDGNTRAVILNLNTPGGGVYESALISNKMEEVQAAGKPIVAVMENTAASGGLWIAVHADYIVAHPETITGSIGVLIQAFEFDGLLNKVGVQQIIVTNDEASNKILDQLEDENSENYRVVKELLNESYQDFLNTVLSKRGITREDLGNVTDGRIITGKKAREVGLVDELGIFSDAVDYLKETEGLNNPSIKEYDRMPVSFFRGFYSKLDMISGITRETASMKLMYMPAMLLSDSGKEE